MVRVFVDTLNPNQYTSETELLTCVKLVRAFNFSVIWLSNLPTSLFDQIKKNYQTKNFLIYPRLDLDTRKENKEDIVHLLRQNRRKYPIIGIECTTPDIAAWAAQDNRIDILKFPVLQFNKLFSLSVGNLMQKFNKFLEVPLSTLYASSERIYIPIIRETRFALSRAVKKGIPIIFNSSGSKPTDQRNPLELAALGHILCLDSQKALDGISTIPNTLLEHNLKKIDSNYIMPGVFRFNIDQNEEE